MACGGPARLARYPRNPRVPSARAGEPAIAAGTACAGKLTGVPESHARAGRLPVRTAAALVVALALSLAGCAKFDSALGQRWATVSFKTGTPATTMLKVRAACSHIPNVHAEALPHKQTAAAMMYALTYRTDNASDANLAQLQQCLQRFPSVQGIQFGDSGDAG